MHYGRIPNPGACCNQPAEPLGHILFRNRDVFSCGRETEHLILIEGYGKVKIVPLGILDDYGCLGEIVQDIRDFCQKGFIGSEYLLRIEREIQSANQFLQILISLQDPKETNQIAVKIVDDFFFNRLFP